MIIYEIPYSEYRFYSDLPKVEGHDKTFLTTQKRPQLGRYGIVTHQLPDVGEFLKFSQDSSQNIQKLPICGYTFGGRWVAPVVEMNLKSWSKTKYARIDSLMCPWQSQVEEVIFTQDLTVIRSEKQTRRRRKWMRELMGQVEAKIKQLGRINKRIRREVVIDCGYKRYYLHRANDFGPQVYSNNWSRVNGVPVLTTTVHDQKNNRLAHYEAKETPKIDSLTWVGQYERQNHWGITITIKPNGDAYASRVR